MSDAFVAVLERHGRFLTAEPLFPDSAPAEGHGRRSRSARVTLGPARSGSAGRVRAQAGQLVLVQGASRKGGARVVRVIGRPDRARDVIESLLLDRGLRREFPRALEQEARAAGEHVRREAGRRRDLRHLPTFTIDPASARDFDDAISAEPLEGEDGGVRMWVHIADVAAHVPEGSALDREALRRATSVYAPGAVEPMLPHALSSDACSLLPGVERPAVSVELHVQGARVVRAAFHRSLIRSDMRLDYEQVDRIFAGAEAAAEPWGHALALARRAAGALGEQRERRGALVIESEEPEFQLDEHGDVIAVLPRAQTESHRLIEHLMIAANEAVAELLQHRHVPCLYRVHERPEPERVRRLADQLATLDVPTPPLPEHMTSTQAAELVGEMSRRVERHVRATGRGRLALGALVLRSLMQAYYSPKNIGHAGLRSPCYCHFTSPIRRYPDLVCHRALLSTLGEPERPPRPGQLAELGAWTSERERHAMTIERDADDVARCFVLARALRELGPEHVFEGEITGLISAGAFLAFGEQAAGEGGPHSPAARAYQGMLPVRLLRVPAIVGARSNAAADSRSRATTDSRSRGRAEAAGAHRGAHGRAGGARRRPEQEGVRDWWELNEQGTILHGERTGSTLRLGDELRVRVEAVDTIRGRVDLVLAG